MSPHEQEELKLLITQLRSKKAKIVLTQGTFDLIHIGHARYLREAKNHGDFLIVGVDDDAKARGRKGENRPVVPLVERTEMLMHLKYVDKVITKASDDQKWFLIKFIRPDTLIAVDGTYTEAELSDLTKICGRVVVLPRQAETSTSSKVRTLVLDGAETITRILIERTPKLIKEVYDSVKNGEAK